MSEQKAMPIQGDVMLVRIGELEPGMEKLVAKPVTVAEGESGNVHVVEKAVWLVDAINAINSDGWYLNASEMVVIPQPTSLVHEAATEEAKSDTHHRPIHLEPGIYQIRLQTEHDYEQQRPVPVWD